MGSGGAVRVGRSHLQSDALFKPSGLMQKLYILMENRQKEKGSATYNSVITRLHDDMKGRSHDTFHSLSHLFYTPVITLLERNIIFKSVASS